MIDLLHKLEDDWDGYGSPAPTAKAIEQAKKVGERSKDFGLRNPRYGPTTEGGVEVIFTFGDCYCNVVCFNSGLMVYNRFGLHADLLTEECPFNGDNLDTALRHISVYLMVGKNSAILLSAPKPEEVNHGKWTTGSTDSSQRPPHGS